MLTLAFIVWLFGLIVTLTFFLQDKPMGTPAMNVVGGLVLSILFGWAIVIACYAYWLAHMIDRILIARAERVPKHH